MDEEFVRKIRLENEWSDFGTIGDLVELTKGYGVKRSVAHRIYHDSHLEIQTSYRLVYRVEFKQVDDHYVVYEKRSGRPGLDDILNILNPGTPEQEVKQTCLNYLLEKEKED